MTDNEIGKFVRFEPVSIDTWNRLLVALPEALKQDVVEIPDDERPSDEVLDIRCSYY